MDDYINRQTIIDAIHSALYPYFCGAEDGDALSEDEKLVLSVNKTVCTAIKALPSADVQPVRHGHWIIPRFGADAKCSVCGYYFNDAYDMENEDNYCRHCGALMDEVT